jgi:homocysteine S-methyltransferase
VSGSPLDPFLAAQGVVVLDGGLATALEAAGYVLDTHLWSASVLLEAPQAIIEVHRRYLEAGADCITTASYQATHAGFGQLGLSPEECDEALRLSVRLALRARDDFWARDRSVDGRMRPVVAASIGPYGAYLADGSEYDGRYGVGSEDLVRFHRRRFEVLAASEADILACETIPSRVEADVLLSLLDEATDAWAWLSFSCRDGCHLWDGTPFVDAVSACSAHERVAAVGVNCTAPGHISELLGAAERVTDLPLLAYPNSGERFNAVTKAWEGSGAGKEWLEGVDEWYASGARVVGGCCRVGPDVIRALRARLTA